MLLQWRPFGSLPRQRPLPETAGSRTYCLEKRSSHHDDEVARRIPQWILFLEVQIKSKIRNLPDSILMHRLLSTLKWACDTNGVHERASLCLLQILISLPTVLAFNARIMLKSNLHRRQKMGTITSDCEAVNILREIYKSDYSMAE